MNERRYIAWCKACLRFGMYRRLLANTQPEQFICPSCDPQELRSYRPLDAPGKKEKAHAGRRSI